MTTTKRKQIALPSAEGPRPDEKPTFRFWGAMLPPKNAEILCRVDPRVTEDGTKATIRLYGPIDPWGGFWGVSSKEVAEALDALDDTVTEILLRINSPGGSCFEGLAILNLLRAHSAKVTAVVDGLAASAASFIAAGCDDTVMSPGTTMMIHDPCSSAWGCNADEMRKTATILDKIADSMSSLYADAAGGKPTDWRAAMQEETWYTAEEAVEAGLAQSVGVVADVGPATTAGGDDDEDLEEVEPDPDLAARFDLSAYTYAGRANAPAPKPPSASAVGSHETEGGSAVAFSNEQLTTMRNSLGLPEDADEATILAAIQKRPAKPEGEPQNTTQVPEGHVVIPAAELSDLKAGAKLAETIAAKMADRDAEAFLDGVKSKFLPANRDAWKSEFLRDAKATAEHFEKAPVIIAEAEIGHSEETTTDIAPEDAAELNAFVAQFGLTMGDLNG